MTEPVLEFAEIARRTRALGDRARATFTASTRDDVRALIAALPAQEGDTVLRVAVIGAYDAGKSTLISALTSRTDVVIGADVMTQVVTAYRWNGLDIVDTPGIHAGHPEHDALTYDAIDKADLILFVVSDELFDTLLAGYFREIVLVGERASHTMLVVNKMTQGTGTAADKLPDLARVTAPLDPADLRTTFIDARCVVDSREASAEDAAALLEESGWGAFLSALNGFVRERGHLGRLALPLHELMAALGKAEALLASVDGSADRIRLELLHRKRVILVDSQRRLRADLSALTDKACTDIGTLGDRLAESIDASAKPEVLERTATSTSRSASQTIDKLLLDADAAVAHAVAELDAALVGLSETPLARTLEARLKVEASWGAAPDLTAPTGVYRHGQRGVQAAEGSAAWLAKLATGPGKEAGAGAAAAAGSKLHDGVYAAGKLFGHNFQPWEAVNIAKNIGNAARVIGVVAGLLGPVIQYLDERHQEKVTKDLREARASIREAYRDASADVSAQLQAHTTVCLTALYSQDIEAVDEEHRRIVGAAAATGAELRGLADLRAECLVLLRQLAGTASQPG